MDPSRFDNLARVLSAASGRRPLLAAVLGAALGGALDDAAAKKRGKSRRRNQQARDANARLAAERGGAGAKRRKKSKKKRRGGNDGGQPPPPPPDCCGTDSCPDPEPGSTSSDCDFAGRSFAGQDLNGSIFRRIDGRDANFTATDNQGSIFADACLQGAHFRRARLGGSTWGGACLFNADFTGADLGGDSAVFTGALFCGTVMPDGSVNDRDCGRATACCRSLAEPGPDPACQTAADCPDEGCRTKACTNGQCVYTVVADGTSPNGECATYCCEGECCAAGATECNPDGLCCAPNCAGRVCGPDGCGNADGCGVCPNGEACDESTGRCLCDGQSCDGCCDADAGCQPGNTEAACGSDGETCVQCTSQQECVNGACETVSCTGSCSTNNDCPDFRNCICNQAQGVCCQRNCAGKVCGPDGCGGLCGDDCPDGTVCSPDGSACLCTAQTCPTGCCTNGPGQGGECEPGDSGQACGTGGARCAECGPGSRCQNQQCVCEPDCGNKDCGPDGCGGSCGTCSPGQVCDNDDGECICTGQTCPNGCCTNGSGKPGSCLPGTTIQACGTGGEECETCDDDDEVCQGGQCVECGDNEGDICPCTGQSICDLADSATCFQRPPRRPGFEEPTCNCLVSLTGEPVCTGSFQTSPSNCTADADCQAYAPGGVCVAAAPDSVICPTAGSFCAAPCCTPQSCPNGCCDGLTTCRPGNEFGFCGAGGALCVECVPGQVCRNGQCATCAPDCVCDATRNFCVSGGSSNVQCQGEDGADPCFCTITAEDNPFCFGVIQPGPPSNCTNDAECQGFAQGAACILAAPEGSECPSAGNFCAAPCCTPQSCPNGCCFGGICVPGGTKEACGSGGVQCTACPGNCSACRDGECVELFVNGDPCTQGSQCCSGACFNGFCAEPVTQCGGTACNPPANGCAGNTCCQGSDTSGCGNVCCGTPCCGAQCCGADQFCCGSTICCANGQECGGPNCPLG